MTLFWILFVVFILAMIILDLFVINRDAHKIEIKEALWWSAFWVGLALAFNVVVYFWKGAYPAQEYLTAYIIELSLSVDNLFVFILLFQYFQIPEKHQHKVLIWGILGALLFRALFIFLGIQIIEKFEFTLYILGAFLIYAGVKMGIRKEHAYNPEKNLAVRFIRKFFPIVKNLQGGHFFIKKGGKTFATPLLVVLLAIEMTDIVFAMDSIPAVLAVSHDPFIIYTSNIFAILGLRSIFFALAGLMYLFHYLKYGLMIILIFIGIKIFVHEWVEIPTWAALTFVITALAGSVILSLIFPQKKEEIEIDDRFKQEG